MLEEDIIFLLLLAIKHHLNTDERLFELFCIKNDFPKSFA